VAVPAWHVHSAPPFMGQHAAEGAHADLLVSEQVPASSGGGPASIDVPVASCEPESNPEPVPEPLPLLLPLEVDPPDPPELDPPELEPPELDPLELASPEPGGASSPASTTPP
jgi:hypothetical protein